MPPQDSETLARTASSDRQITCETLANDNNDRVQELEESSYSEHPDLPESFWLSKDAELDWFDRNAFFDRKDSTKTTHNHNNNSISVSNSNPSSQRFTVTKKSKTSIIGLPKPQQKPCLVEAKHRRNQTNSRLFPKRASGKPEAPMAEPSSPKVSCMGRVRSRRDRNRRLKNRQRSLKSSSAAEKPTERRKKKKSLWKNLRSIFGSGSGRKPAPEPESQTTQGTRTASRSHVPARDLTSALSPPGLAAMARYSSGRRSDAWVGDVAEIRCREFNGASLQKRRDAGPLTEVNCGRDWGSVGPASV